MKMFRCIAFLLLALALAGFSKKKEGFSLTFNVEANAQDSSTFSMPVPLKNLNRQAYIEKMPSITEREIESIYPFAAPDGTMGCTFRLDNHGRMWLDTVSVENNGKALVAIMSGRIVFDMLIDKRVSDGIITISSGLTNEEISILKSRYRVMGTKSNTFIQGVKKALQ